jgi:hypothetical protein
MKALFLAAGIFATLCASQAQAQTGCASVPNAKPDIVGTYVDNYGYLRAVLDRYWVSDQGVFVICSVDNLQHRLIAWNAPANPTDPGKYSRVEWVTFENRLWYCQSVYDALSEAAAAAAPLADPSNPVVKGCGNFAWSSLIRLLR